jgi:hypothetical protein
MDIEQLYRDYNVPFVTENHKHSRPGWVNTPCPFCTGNPGFHLGYSKADNMFVCWRCGGHYVPDTIARLIHVGRNEAFIILRQYGVLTKSAPEIKRKIKIKAFKYPNNTSALQTNHIKYLLSRDFDPDKIVQDYGILGTSVVAMLDKLNYKHRLIIPFTWNGKIVSFDSRDITGKATNKYQACPADREEVGHKDILYGLQHKWTDVGICVEGPTDVWRMGPNAFAVSGIKYKPAQVRCMAKQFKRIAVLFDDDPQAIVQANKLVADLKFRGVDSFRVDIQGDPGGLSQQEADYLVKQLIK